MFSSRIFWKIYLGFILFVALTGAVVEIFVTRQTYSLGIVVICVGVLLALLFGFFLARRIAEEVSRRELAESALKKSGQFENLFKHANDAILIFEPENETVLNVNDKACEMYGLSREEFIGRSLKERSQNIKRGSQELEKLLHDGVYEEFESVHLRGDDTPLDLVINASVIEYENRPAILTINRDVGQRKQMEEDLRERERHLLSVTNSAQDAIVSADNRGDIIFWNDGARKIFGYEEKEVIGKPLSILVPEKYREAHAEGMGRHLKTGEKRIAGQAVELEGLRKNGAEFPLELLPGVWETANGEYFTGIMRDITERKVAENAIKESERSYRFLGEGIMHQVWTSLPDGKLDYVNQRTAEYFGRKTEQIIGDGWQSVVHPDDLPTVLERWTLSLTTGVDYEVEFRLKRADGEYRWHSGLATTGRDGDGKIVKWFGTNTDIDDKKAAEKTQRESEEKFRSFVETTKDWIWEVDENGICIYNNPAVETILGYTPAELEGRSFLPFMCEEDGAEVKRVFPQFIRERRGWTNLVCRWRHKDGSIRYLESSAVPIFGDGGEVVGFRGTDHDITERKQSENALRRLQSALDATQDGVFMFDPATLKFFYVNQGAIKQVGYSQAELLRMTPLDIKLKSTEESFRRTIAPMIGGAQNSIFFNTVHRHKDGTDIPVEIILQIVAAEDGKNLFVAMARDITERKQEEMELSKLAAIVEFSNDAIFSKDLDGIVTSWNVGAEDLFGYRTAEIIGQHISILSPPERLDEEADIIENIKKGKSVKNFETVHISKTGTHIPVSLTVSPIRNSEGEVVGISKVAHDITERKRAIEKLRDSQQWLKAILDGSRDGILIEDDSEIIYVNDSYSRLLGYDVSAELIGKNVADILPPDEAQRLTEYGRRRLLGEQVPSIYEFKGKRKDGTLIEVEGAVSTSVISGNKFVMTAIRDITERKRAREELQKNVSLLTSTFEATADGILVVDINNKIVTYNQKFLEMWQIPENIITTMDNSATLDFVLNHLINADGFLEVTKRLMLHPEVENDDLLELKNGKTYERHSHPQILDDDTVGRVLSFRDITERKRAEEQLQHDAFHDGLTGLANRSLFMEHLQTRIERGKRGSENMYAVMFLDFDRFKIINDSLGHAEGDRLLRKIAKRLESSLRPGDLVARLGGDEFTILLSRLDDEKDALQIAERIQKNLELPFNLGGREVFTSASIGIAVGTPGGDNQAEEMLRDADIAMYRAKAKGKATYQVFDKEMHEHAIERMRLETEMRQALEGEQFRAHYQPIIDIETNNLMGFESLIRWHHPERGIIPSFEFIPVAEENNLILPIGNWILRESCRQLREWQNEFPEAANLTVSVNLSSKEFLQIDLAEQISETLRETGLNPHCLKLEITETHVMENSEMAVTIMNRLCALGIKLSLDDFGTGYSSLSYLHRLPVSSLKIDRSFVMQMAESKENEEIVRTIIKLAQNLKMQVVAEGIENAEQLARLRHLKCEYGQGYFLSKPLEAEKAKILIDQSARNLMLPTDQPIINLDANM